MKIVMNHIKEEFGEKVQQKLEKEMYDIIIKSILMVPILMIAP